MFERTAGGIELCVKYRHWLQEGEEVRSGDGAERVGVVEVGWVEVDEGDTCFASGFWAVGEEGDLAGRGRGWGG